MECTQRSNRDSGFLRTYTIIHAYFALVQGSSHYVSSPSFLYPPCFGHTIKIYCVFGGLPFQTVFHNIVCICTFQQE